MHRFGLACCLLTAFSALPALAQPVPVDGVYGGTASILGTSTSRGSHGRCEQTFAFKLQVQNRSFVWRLPTVRLAVTVAIAPDGTFSAQNTDRFIQGRISGTHLAAQTTGRGCNYAWSFDRQ